ncbi:MAG: DUF2062 domain-containing protein [Proteobacteria bacterium]|nr:DUF2062 domain-containing protein [Pseudomonadota bacterium]
MPAPHALRERWFLRPFGERLSDPQLWTLHRRGVTHAFGVGLAVCFIPLPVHALTAASIAIIWRLNIPVAVASTLLVNPFTIVPAYYLAYRTGALLLRTPPHHFKFSASWHWFSHSLAAVWQPFLLGCLVCALGFGVAAWLAFEAVWRWHVRHRYRTRHTV